MLFIDERHLVFACPMQSVRDRCPALFSPAKDTLQQHMWQPDNVGCAHPSWIVLMCLVPCLCI